jgi:hypothetical protein
MFTVTLTRWATLCQALACAQAFLSTQGPMDESSPVRSAMGMNSDGETRPCSAFRQRRSASMLWICPVTRSTIGW